MARGRINRSPADQLAFETERRNRRADIQRRRRDAARQAVFEHNRGIMEDYLGPMNVQCVKCNAKHFTGEKVENKKSFNDCCSHGMVSLSLLDKRFPVELESLFKGDHEKSNLFFDRIRVYNSSLAFASFNANLVNFRN